MAGKLEKMNLYLLVTVGIVAVVGIVVLVLNSQRESISINSDDLTGEAFKISSTDRFGSMKPIGYIYPAKSAYDAGEDECGYCSSDENCCCDATVSNCKCC